MAKCPVCDKVGTHTCAGCKEVVYCCKEHQVQHWKEHKSICRPFEVQQSKELGRYLVAKRDIDAGTQVISELPLVLGPKTLAEPMCLGCYQPVDPETCARCSSCEWPVCNPNCPGLAKQDHHLPECIVFSLNCQPQRMGRLNYDAILPLRCLLLQRRSPKKWKQLLSMESHFKERNTDTEIYKEIEDNIVKYLKENYLMHVEAGILQNVSSEIIHIICGIIEVNALEVSAGGEGDVMALYSNACLMEHNCLPNVKYKFNLDDYKIIIESTMDLKRGDHLCTMYTHTLWGTFARREHLSRTKYFVCKCDRCCDPTELGTEFSSLKCIGTSNNDITEKCKGLVRPVNAEMYSDWSCNNCPVVLSAEHVTDIVSRLGADVDAAMESPTVPKLEKLLSKLEILLHENHYHCFTVAHSLIQLWGRQPGYSHEELTDNTLKRKIDICRRLILIIDKVDSSGSRVQLYLAVCLLELSLALEEEVRRHNIPLRKEILLREARDQLERAKYSMEKVGLGACLYASIKAAYDRITGLLNQYKVIEID